MTSLLRLSSLITILALLVLHAAPAQAAAAYVPRPALIAPLAASRLALDVVDTGARYIAVGERGQILASDDGRSWSQQPVPVRSALTAVSFADADHGWAVGHDAVILATADGGKTWNLQNYAPELEKPLLDVLFIDARRGYAIGAFGLFLVTEDGGGNWTPMRSPVVDEDELNLYAIARLGNGDLLITGEQGRLLLSNDDGQTWKRYRSPVNATLFGAAAIGARGALICGLRGNAYVSADVRSGGWKAIDTGSTAAFYGCAGIGDDRALLVGADGIILLADLAARRVRRLKSPAGGAWSALVPRKSGVVLAGERGLHLLGPVVGR
ncbi:YCF48-related protein [Nevskia sp.]|uniref:WD40/YVTN/BNR-like repeat-containing protein n=1 Tax=Nevskia sp. TaxID=1929292 RepID=UPI0025F13422|nr:YCF48-related protein [Nevskia sp.]